MPDGTMENMWSRLTDLDGRVRVMESKASDWEDAVSMINDLRVSVERLNTYTKITWGFLFAFILALISTAISVFSQGVI